MLSGLAHETALIGNGFSCFSSGLSVALLPPAVTQDYSDAIGRSIANKISMVRLRTQRRRRSLRMGNRRQSRGGGGRTQESSVTLASSSSSSSIQLGSIPRSSDALAEVRSAARRSLASLLFLSLPFPARIRMPRMSHDSTPKWISQRGRGEGEEEKCSADIYFTRGNVDSGQRID